MRLCTLLILQLPFALCAKPLSINVAAEAAIVMNADTGKILYAKQIHKQMVPASVTKIATAVYALKILNNQVDALVTIPKDAVVSTTAAAKKKSNYTLPAHWLEPDGTHIGLKTGEVIPLRDLFYGLMLVSGNDAANAIAMHIDGNVPQFMDNMNRYLQEIGCKETHYDNPHGLYMPRHKTTAYDLAVMTREGLKNPLFRQIVSSVSYPRSKTNLQERTLMSQYNKLLKPGKFYYKSAIGVKTGYLAIAGKNFVTAAHENGRTLIVVLLKNEDRNTMFEDAIRVFKTAFAEKQVERQLLGAGEQNFTVVLEGSSTPVETHLERSLAIQYYPSEEPDVKVLAYWDAVALPIVKEQRLGEVRAVDGHMQVLAVQPLLAKNSVEPSWNYRISKLISDHPWLTGLIVLITLVFTAMGIVRRTR